MTALRGIGVLLLAGVATAGLTLAALLASGDRAAEAASEQAALTARVDGLTARIAALEGADVAAAEDVTDRAPVALIAADQGDAEVRLQERILALLDAAAIYPLGFGPALAPDDYSLSAAAFDVEFEGGYAETLDLLDRIESGAPPMAIGSLWIRHLPTGSLGDVETPVAVRMTVWALWAAPAEAQGKEG